MIIERVLNNNTISCIDENGNEIILKGKGIAFQSSRGGIVDNSKIEKRFILENQDTNRKFQELLTSIPDDILDTSEEIIELIKDNIDKKISDNIHVTLADHIANLLERIRLGINFDNTILYDVRRMYQQEYEIAIKAVEIINTNLNIKLENDEASFIALHIVNAELDLEMKDVYMIASTIHEICDYIEKFFGLTLNESDLISSRFILHLRFFIERIMLQREFPKSKNEDLLEILTKKYTDQYKCVEEIIHILSKKFNSNVGEDDKLYLLIHIVKLTT